MDSLSLELTNRLPEIQRMIDCVEAFGRRNALPENVVWQFALALDELVTNVVSYGYRDEDPHAIVVSMRLSDGWLTADIVDDGIAFDPLQTPPPDLDADLDGRPIGGLGVHFVRKMMDSVEYRRDGGKNHLTIAKALA